MVISICCSYPVLDSLICVYPALIVNVEPILQEDCAFDSVKHHLTLSSELRSLDASIRDNVSSVVG